MADIVNLFIDQGSHSIREFNTTDDNGNAVPLIGHTAALTVRSSVNGPAILELTTDDDISIEESNGIVNVVFSHTATSAIRFNGARFTGVYDLEVTNTSSIPTRIAEGQFVLFRNVTT